MPILCRGKITCSKVLSYYTTKFLQGFSENLTSFLLLSKEQTITRGKELTKGWNDFKGGGFPTGEGGLLIWAREFQL
jgi:hypothetical protein